MLALLCALASCQLVLTRTPVFPCWPQAAGLCQCNSSWKWSCGLLVLGSRAKMDTAELLEGDACSMPLERDKGKYVVIPTKHSENLEQCMHQTGSYWSMTLVFLPVSTSCPRDLLLWRLGGLIWTGLKYCMSKDWFLLLVVPGRLIFLLLCFTSLSKKKKINNNSRKKSFRCFFQCSHAIQGLFSM